MGLPGTPTRGGKVVSSNKKGGAFGSVSDLLFGEQQQAIDATTELRGANVQTPGFSLNSILNRGGQLATTLTPKQTAARLALQSRFPEFLRDIGELRQEVRPGFSAFREAGLGQLRNERDATVGNLRESLSRRGVLGSSFGQDVVGRTRAEFGQKRAQFAAQTTLQEMEATRNLIQFESQLIMEQINREFQELNFAAGFGANTQSLINQNAAIRVGAILGDEKVRLGRNKLTFEVGKTVASFFGGGLGAGGGGKGV